MIRGFPDEKTYNLINMKMHIRRYCILLISLLSGIGVSYSQESNTEVTVPAFGGGISTDYRLPITHDKQWRMEFSLGTDVYGVHYDNFSNRRNGLLVETKRRVWFDIDQPAAPIVYTLDFKKKGGA